MTKEMEKRRWELLPNVDNETVKIWLDKLLENNNRMVVGELTVEEIKSEIKEVNESIENFNLWGNDDYVKDCEEYIEVLEDLIK